MSAQKTKDNLSEFDDSPIHQVRNQSVVARGIIIELLDALEVAVRCAPVHNIDEITLRARKFTNTLDVTPRTKIIEYLNQNDYPVTEGNIDLVDKMVNAGQIKLTD